MVNVCLITLELFSGVLCLAFLFLLLSGRRMLPPSGIQMTRLLTLDALALFFSAAVRVFSGSTSPLGYVMTRAAQVLSDLLLFAMLALCALCIRALLTEHEAAPTPWMLPLTVGLAAAGALPVVLSPFFPLVFRFDGFNRRVAGPVLPLCMIAAAAGLCVILAALLRGRAALPDHTPCSLPVGLLLPFAAGAVQLCRPALTLLPLAATGTVWCMFFTQQAELSRRLEDQSQTLSAQKEELLDQRLRMIVSQIQPHFLYNSLSSISTLCRLDPVTAEQAVDRFADYLRMNLNTISNERLIEFSDELEHTRTYLWLEQLRFGPELHIEYDIRCTDFLLPPLVLQPLAENAVKHGVCKREDCGTVRITAFAEDTDVHILVEDDGVGFDPAALPVDGRQHVGIANVRERLARLCGGTLTVESTPGVGTRAEILLKGALQNEDPLD